MTYGQGRPAGGYGDYDYAGDANGYDDLSGVSGDIYGSSGEVYRSGGEIYGSRPAPADRDQPEIAGYGLAGGYDDPDAGGYDKGGAAGYDKGGYGEAAYGETAYPDPGYDETGYDAGGSTGSVYGGAAAQVSGDPNYRARRHRPSANDTNVGSLEDFAEYGGYPAAQPDDRYARRGRW